jgi:uroporphyrinogen decarboxylase
MTRRERVLNTIERKSIDCLPSNIYFASQRSKTALQKEMGFATEADLDEYLDNHLVLAGLMDDVFRFAGDHAFLRQAEVTPFARVDWEKNILWDRWGVGYSTVSDGIRMVHFPLAEAGPQEIHRFQVPELFTPGNFDYLEREVRAYSDGRGLVVPLGYGGIYERSLFLMGYENLLLNMAAEPAMCEELFDKILEYKIEYAHWVVKQGFRVAHTSDDYGTQTGLFMSADMWRRFFKPRLAKIWRIFRDAGIHVFHHSCGNIVEILPDMVDIGLSVLEPTQRVMDLAYLKREFGKDLTFWGGIGTQTVLPNGSPEDVRNEVAYVIETLGRGGGLIISPDQDVMADVPVENIRAMVETIQEKRRTVL